MTERRQRQRRTTNQRTADRRQDTLGPALKPISKREVESILSVSDARVEIRCPATTKDEIEAIAGRFGLTVTTYLLRLHELARSRLDAEHER